MTPEAQTYGVSCPLQQHLETKAFYHTIMHLWNAPYGVFPGCASEPYDLTPESKKLRRFIIQAASGDGNAATSDGIFVVLPATAAMPAVNAVVTVRGVVTEYFGLTRIEQVSQVHWNRIAAVQRDDV